MRRGWPRSRISPRVGRRQAEEDAGQLRAARARPARPGPGSRRRARARFTPRARRRAAAADARASRARRRRCATGRFGNTAVELAADHQADQLGRASTSPSGRVATTRAVAQHRHAVGDLRATPPAGARCRRCRRPARAARGSARTAAPPRVSVERGRRLVHEQHARARPPARARSRRAAARPCAGAPPGRRDRWRAPTRASSSAARARGARSSGRAASRRAAPGRGPCSRRRSGRGTGPAAGRSARRRARARAAGRARRRARPPTSTRAGVGAVGAGDDLDQRALARAVLADERVDLARHELERHAAQRADAAEGFAHAGESQEAAHAPDLSLPG